MKNFLIAFGLLLQIGFCKEPIQYNVHTVTENIEREQSDPAWVGSSEYIQELYNTIEKMHYSLLPYLKLSRLFKPFLAPFVRMWAKKRNFPDTPLLRWSKTTVAAEREEMHKNNKSFAQLKVLIYHMGLFSVDLSLQTAAIYKKCLQCAETYGGKFTKECLLEAPRINLSFPGFSIIEKLDLVNSDRVIGLLEALNIILYGE